jgi:hypothetical protein
MFEELLKGEVRLFQNGESAFRKLTVDRNHRLQGFAAVAFLKRDVTSFLAEFHKTRSFESSNDALTGNARQFCHVTQETSTVVQKESVSCGRSGRPQVSRYSSTASVRLARALSTS